MSLKIGKCLVLLLLPFVVSTQNCSRRVIVSEVNEPVVIHHAAPHDYTKLRFMALNLPDWYPDNQLNVDVDLANNSVQIESLRLDGGSCTKSFSINPVLSKAFQETLQSMSYEETNQADHLFSGDNFLTLTGPQGLKNLVLDAASIPTGVAKVMDPVPLYYMIQGLIYSDEADAIENCSGTTAHQIVMNSQTETDL